MFSKHNAKNNAVAICSGHFKENIGIDILMLSSHMTSISWHHFLSTKEPRNVCLLEINLDLLTQPAGYGTHLSRIKISSCFGHGASGGGWGYYWTTEWLLTTNIPWWKPGVTWSDKHTNDEEKRKEVELRVRELGSTNEIETREILTTNTTIYTTAKVSLP